MKYDASKYRELGVGERIEEGDFVLWAKSLTPDPVSGMVGEHVDEEWSEVYLRPLQTSTIPKDTYPSGAARSAAEGRGRFDLIPYEAMLSLAKRYEMGAKVFGENNWLKGQPLSRLLSSMRRHAHQINYDFSEDHVGAVLWNAAAFVTMCAKMEAGILPKQLDDIGYFMNQQATKQ